MSMRETRSFKVTPLAIPDVLLIQPKTYSDERGFFRETFSAPQFAELGLPTTFAQDNVSRSAPGVLRGLHFQLKKPQGKLVSVLHGSVFDVAVDVRKGSPTFGKHVSVNLTAEGGEMLWVPRGFAHGFCVTSKEQASFAYKCDALYDAVDELGLIWNDPALSIRWPIQNPLVSSKDQALKRLADLNL
jgi:dTDP-4-dehydrorhamnose 3,5-epimerase